MNESEFKCTLILMGYKTNNYRSGTVKWSMRLDSNVVYYKLNDECFVGDPIGDCTNKELSELIEILKDYYE